MYLIGDLHGKISQYKSLIEEMDESIQVGDFKIGFPGYNHEIFPETHKFIRGNHDNPEVCRNHPNYLGEFGIYKDYFYISGGFSKDKIFRIENADWWKDEELSTEQAYELIDLYEKTKPEIIISHQCPQFIEANLFDFRPIPNKTVQLLQVLLDIHKPKIWAFGHYHMSRNEIINGCRYICLNELETIKI